MSDPLSKITDLAGAAANPLSAAKSTLEAARGFVNEGYGLVEDVRAIAEKETKRRELKQDQAAIQGAIDKHRAAKRVAKRAKESAANEYNAKVSLEQSAIEKVLIEKTEREEEHAMIWAMSADEREAYLVEKKKQIEERRQEERRIARERAIRQERWEIFWGVVICLAITIPLIWAGFSWLANNVRN